MIAYLRKIWPKGDIHATTKRFNERFKVVFTEDQVKSCLSRHRIKSGRTGCFEKGIITWNSGTKGMGVCRRNSGTFKKGNVPGNIRRMGSQRVDAKDGYLLIKVRETNPYTGAPTRFKAKHVVVWEKHHGPVPEGSVVLFVDGNHLNSKINNLTLVTRRELARLNRWLDFGVAPVGVKPSIIALAKLQMKTFDLLNKRNPPKE